MKKFTLKLVTYLGILTLAVICLYLLNSIFLRRTDGLVLKNAPSTLFIGHSHAECAFNDSIITQSKNLSLSAECYFYSYLKLKTVLRKNHISTIFLELSNWQISASMDSTIWKDYYLSRSCKNYQALMGPDEVKLLLNKNPKKLFSVQPVVLKRQLQALISPRSEFYDIMEWGGYLGISKSVTDSILDSYKKPGAVKKYISNRLSTVNLGYLDKILALCREKNVKVYLVRVPMHDESAELVNENEFQALVKSRYKDYPFIDLRRFPVSNDEFADLEHLNVKGSKKFSEYFQNAIMTHQFDSLATAGQKSFNN